MGKMEINVAGIEQSIKPKLKKFKDMLDELYKLLTAIQVPEDFRYAPVIQQSGSKFKTMRANITTTERWLDEVIAGIKQAESANNSAINELQLRFGLIPTFDAEMQKRYEEFKKTFNLSKPESELTAEEKIFKQKMASEILEELQKTMQGNSSTPDVKDPVSMVLGTMTNSIISLAQGVAGVGESLVDTIIIAGAAIDTLGTVICDLINDSSFEMTEMLWDNTMKFVAEDWVSKGYEELYNTEFGKMLNENSLLKSDSVGSEILSGLGYVAGIAALTIATGGVASVGTGAAPIGGSISTAVGTGLAFTAGTGEGTEQAWEKMRDQYSDEDWTNFENAINGLAYGLANGVWEGTQWYLGSTLNGLAGTAGEVGRVGTDTLFNAGDTAFKSLMESQILGDKTFKEAFEENGGLRSTLVDAGVGLIGSAGAEAVDITKKIVNTKIQEQNIMDTFKEIKENEDRLQVQELIDKLDFNKKNLIEGITDNIPKELDDLTKARIIYLKLNQAITYSDQYFAATDDSNHCSFNRTIATELYNKTFDISNMETNSLVCSNIADIYSELLQEVGIDSKRISIIGEDNGHKFVKMDLKNGKILLADSAVSKHKHTDITNSKFGQPTNNFVITTNKDFKKEMKKDTPLMMKVSSLGINNEYSNNIISSIDEYIGYSDTSYKRDFEDILSRYPEDKLADIDMQDKLNGFISLFKGKDMGAIDIYNWMDEYAEVFFGRYYYVNYYTGPNGVISVTTVFLDTERKNKLYLYKLNDGDIELTYNIDEILVGGWK